MNQQIKNSLLENLVRYGIGFDPNFFERSAEMPNFPPHTIAQISEDHYRLTLAVAGFRPAEIEVVQHNDILTIRSHKKAEVLPEGYKVLYGGIAFRDFCREFKIGEYVEVENAALRDGLLQIDLIRRLPDVMKPRNIPIQNTPYLTA
jgi:molecular chaperone IbpA